MPDQTGCHPGAVSVGPHGRSLGTAFGHPLQGGIHRGFASRRPAFAPELPAVSRDGHRPDLR
jgi:hypothetical protein